MLSVRSSERLPSVGRRCQFPLARAHIERYPLGDGILTALNSRGDSMVAIQGLRL